MAISFDGVDIIKHPSVDIKSYEQWKKNHDSNIDRMLEKETVEAEHEAVREWAKSIPDEYKKASIAKLSKYDHAAGSLMRKALDRSISKGRPRNMVIHSSTKASGKTWAVYAWIEDLVRNHVIRDPENEVYVTTEAELINTLTNYGDQQMMNSTRRTVFTHRRKLIVITDCGAMLDRQKKTRISFWEKVLSYVHGTSVAFACTMSRPIGEDADAVMQDEVEAMKKIIRRSVIVDVTEEPDHHEQ